MNNELIKAAKNLAHAAHDSINQRRKYTNEPYWVHTDSVADRVLHFGGDEFDIAAAHLHDYREDVVPTLIKQGRMQKLTEFENIYFSLPFAVRFQVDELTDRFTPENYPAFSRKRRKELEAERIGTISFSSKRTKLADLEDNTKTIVPFDPDFAATYLDEKARVLPLLQEGCPGLYLIVVAQLHHGYSQLGSAKVQASLNKVINPLNP